MTAEQPRSNMAQEIAAFGTFFQGLSALTGSFQNNQNLSAALHSSLQESRAQISRLAAAQEQLRVQMQQQAAQAAAFTQEMRQVKQQQAEVENYLRQKAQDQAARSKEHEAQKAQAVRSSRELQERVAQLDEAQRQVDLQRKALEEDSQKLAENMRAAEKLALALEEQKAQLTQERGPRPEWLPELWWNIGVAGQTGAGKSTIINRFRRLGDRDVGAARVGATDDTTKEPARYPGQGPFEGALLWDLPGAGTNHHPWHSYVRQTGLRHFDAVVLVADFGGGRLEENTLAFFNELSQQGEIPVVLLLNKADKAIQNGLRATGQEPGNSWKELREKAAAAGVQPSRDDEVFLTFNIPMANQEATELRNEEWLRFLRRMSSDIEAAKRANQEPAP